MSQAHTARGQALIELAVMGSILVFVFAAMIRFGMQASDGQAVQQEAFRKALYFAHQARIDRSNGTPVNSATVVVVKDRSTPDPSSPFATSSSSPAVGSASIQWGNDQAAKVLIFDPANNVVTYDAYAANAQNIQTNELAKTFYDVNGTVFPFNAAGFTPILQKDGTPYLRTNFDSNNPLCLFANAIQGVSILGEVVIDDGHGGWMPLDPDPARSNIAVTIDTKNCASNGLVGNAAVTVAPSSSVPLASSLLDGLTCTTLGLFVSCTVTDVTNVFPTVSLLGEALLAAHPDWRVRFWVVDPCMADAIDRTLCKQQCDKIQPKKLSDPTQPLADYNFQLPEYCTNLPKEGAPQGVDFNNYLRVQHTDDRLSRSEQPGTGVTTTTDLDERETLRRTFKGWQKDTNVTTGVTRRGRQRWVTPP